MSYYQLQQQVSPPLSPSPGPIQCDTLNSPAVQIIRSDLTTIFQSDQRQTKAAINLQYHSSSRVAVQSQNFFFKLLSLKSYHNLYTLLSAAVISGGGL